VPSPLRILVVSGDTRFSTWLRHHIEALRDDVLVDAETLADFEHRLATNGTAAFDLVVPLLRFEEREDIPADGLEWLERLRDVPDSPPLVVVAEDGDELTAVQVMRMGALDYVPRRLLTPELLGACLDASLDEARREREPAPAPAPASPLAVPRDLIPRYTLLEVLGESQRATVYLATSAALGRNVALKVSHVIEGEEPHFSREFAAIGALRHPSVVDIYDYGVNEGREYIAMEYFPCGDLKARLQNPISEDESIDYLRRIAAALSVVHAAGLIHRDLKPPNIMLRENGQVVLIDFGLAKSVGGATRSTAAGVLRGSPYYMSPEQAQGGDLDVRSDLYSLGVILYEMLTGAKPYTGTSAVEVLQQHVTAPVPRLPPQLGHHQGMLDGLMAKSREDRYASADEVLSALSRDAA
jgi:ActR/RegA family two-component response regulator